MRSFLTPVLGIALLTVLITPARSGSAAQVNLQLAATHPTMLAGETKVNHLQVALTGFELREGELRPAVNVAIVLDRSGSMRGYKFEQAKQAAIDAIGRLGEDDIVSVIAYNHTVQVLVPATKVRDRGTIVQSIQQMQAGGNTALFAGVSKAAGEVRKFFSDSQVNRVILLSDGKANEGPSSTAELAALGESLLREGISVTTLGLGLDYNEDLMTALASASQGNHAFIEEAADMVAVFNHEFDDLLSVVATDFEIQIELAEGVRPLRAVGCEAEIEGQRVLLPLAQLYATQLRNFVLEIEVQPGIAGSTRPLAEAEVSYRNLETGTVDRLASSLEVRFTDDPQQVQSDINGEALAYCTLQLTTEANQRATELRDSGQVAAAKQLLETNSRLLLECKIQCLDNLSKRAIRDLEYGIDSNGMQAEAIVDSSRWNENRKSMRQFQNSIQQQQRYIGKGKIEDLVPGSPPSPGDGNESSEKQQAKPQQDDSANQAPSISDQTFHEDPIPFQQATLVPTPAKRKVDNAEEITEEPATSEDPPAEPEGTEGDSPQPLSN